MKPGERGRGPRLFWRWVDVRLRCTIRIVGRAVVSHWRSRSGNSSLGRSLGSGHLWPEQGRHGQNLSPPPVRVCRSGADEMPRLTPPEPAGQRPNPIFKRYTIHIRPPYSGIAKRVWHLRVLVTCSPTKYMIVVSASGKLITKLRCLLLRLVGELWWINMTRFATI
jgi:hypothetical protein